MKEKTTIIMFHREHCTVSSSRGKIKQSKNKKICCTGQIDHHTPCKYAQICMQHAPIAFCSAILFHYLQCPLSVSWDLFISREKEMRQCLTCGIFAVKNDTEETGR